MPRTPGYKRASRPSADITVKMVVPTLGSLVCRVGVDVIMVG